MTRYAPRLVAGTDVHGDGAPPVWDPACPDPVDRVLRGALPEGLKHVVVFGGREDGTLYLASSMPNMEGTIGLLARGQMYGHGLCEVLSEDKIEGREEGPDDGA